MCALSVSNVIYHKFSHGAAFYMLNGKNVNVMLECLINPLVSNNNTYIHKKTDLGCRFEKQSSHYVTFWNVYESMLVYTSKIKFKVKEKTDKNSFSNVFALVWTLDQSFTLC